MKTLVKDDSSKRILGETEKKFVEANGRIDGSYISMPNVNQTNNSLVNNISHQELGAIKSYMSGDSYALNARLREGAKLSQQQENLATNVEKALNKLPSYNKPTWSNIVFDSFYESVYNKFIEQHKTGNTVTYRAFTSTSKEPDGYLISDGAKKIASMKIYGKSGKDISTHGMSDEQEFLFNRNSKFEVLNSKTDKDGTSYFHLEEK